MGSAEPPKLPKPHDDAEYAAIERRFNELASEEGRLQSEIDAMHVRMTRGRGAGARNALDIAAEALIAGREPEKNPDTPERLQELRDQQAVAARAVQIQKQRLDDARAAAARRLVEPLKPVYVDKARNVARLIRELMAAATELDAFADAVAANGLGGILPQLVLRGFSRASDWPGGQVWLDEAKAALGVEI